MPLADKEQISRRRFFEGSAGVAGGVGLFAGMSARAEAASKGADLTGPGYGRLSPAGDELSLPSGFQYSVVSYEDDSMADGFPVPKALDGTGAFSLPNGNILLIRNHEDAEAANRLRPRPANSTSTSDGILRSMIDTHFGPRSFAYDAYCGGGTTSVEVDPRTRRKVREWWSLVGTLRNCAGGVTPWDSWLSCEESTTAASATGYAKDHGYVFEVPVATSPGRPAEPIPLKQLGIFAHEAVAVDPTTGIIYETEDQGDVSGFYRFVPTVIPIKPGDLATVGGRLEMLKVNLADGYETAIEQRIGVALPVSWVSVPNPDPRPITTTVDGVAAAGVFRQGLAAGGAVFRRLEGIWFSQGKFYFTATSGGDAGLGQIWVYDPKLETLTLVFETPNQHVLDFPDNIAVSPRGGLIVCEDGTGAQYLRGVTPSGTVFDFARNIFNGTEFTGACFSPDGLTLFVNIYGRSSVRTIQPYRSPVLVPAGSELHEKGLTLAIWGPWGSGLL